MKIPLMDLYVAHEPILDEVMGEIRQLVVDSAFINGARLTEFEESFAQWTGAKHCVGLTNGTEAITIALKSCGIQPGDEVITVSHTFIATVEAILLEKAVPVLVDVDEATGLMDIGVVESAITSKTKAIIPVHLYGNPVDLDRLQDITRKHGLSLIQDSAQAHGAKWNGQPLGFYGEAQTYSFFPGKNLGAWGDAGALCTSDSRIVEFSRAHRDHGRAPGQKYLHHSLGGNWRMDPIQALVLSKKLASMDQKNQRRRALKNQYMERLDGVGDLSFFKSLDRAEPVHHLFVIKTERRDDLKEWLEKEGISCGIHYPTPVHLQPVLGGVKYRAKDLRVTEKLATQILSLPFFPEMTVTQMDYVTQSVRRFFK